MYNSIMRTLFRVLAKLLYVVAVGILLAIVSFWIGGKLFPSNNHDLSDITQGFFQLGIGILGFIVGIVIGSITFKHFRQAKP